MKSCSMALRRIPPYRMDTESCQAGKNPSFFLNSGIVTSRARHWNTDFEKLLI